MLRRLVWCLVLGALGVIVSKARAGQFDQLDGPTLARTLKGADVAARPSLTIADLAAMPSLLKDTRSALVLARTDLGNPARLLIVPELRKPADGKGEPIPVVVLERLDSFDASDPSARLASRRDVVVFDGFQVDLDTGQVVPEGQGGDVVFRAGGELGPRLETIHGATLFTLAKAPAVDASKGPQPTPGKAVVPGDFAGRYRLFANGQWSGTLDLKVEGRGSVVGTFRSDLHGTTYAVSGQVAADSAQKVFFAIKYPRARQEFEGYLWAEGKGAMAGVASIADRPVGFFAIRDGGRFAPEAADAGPLQPGEEAARPARHVVEIVDGKVTLDGKPTDLGRLADELRAKVGAEVGGEFEPWALVRVAEDRPFSEVKRATDAIEAAGVRTIRLEPASAPK